MAHDQRSISVYDLGVTNYGEVHRLQRRLQAQRREGAGVDSLLITEHRPVFTLGQSHREPNLRVSPDVVANYGIEVVQTERGGDITYHGPGQLVAYGIVDLKGWQCSVLDYLNGLEEAAIGVLADWGIRGQRNQLGRGTWVEDRKIASVGLNVRRWITMHGIALNVDPDMSHFDLINPCGMSDVEVTSISAELNKQVPLREVNESFIFHFGRVFDCHMAQVDLSRKTGTGGG
jgi:lipoate-protein ligase B